jgi:hypothetical protein
MCASLRLAYTRGRVANMQREMREDVTQSFPQYDLARAQSYTSKSKQLLGSMRGQKNGLHTALPQLIGKSGTGDR